ncbi:tRNA-specific 2-thiouridylase MnmA [Candidatus Xiphinematobacter sp. Idaho Grape]|nr:tRNA-specific 2-thiouridylase MnmA [Candidatus Xiphinematobacter sp. Idaho Grape]
MIDLTVFSSYFSPMHASQNSKAPSYLGVGGGKRVLVGMSGGVDSSVAAYLLREGGWDVIGVTMKVWPQDCLSRTEDKCCGPQAVADARRVAHVLDIPHYVVDEAMDFERLVIDYFSREYRAGRTPNPCIICNEKLKFGNLWEKAKFLDADYVATGHYATIRHTETGAILCKGTDLSKDQSYFLFSLSQEQLTRVLTPLGGMTKPEVRDIARQLGMQVADKKDSQEICFIPNNDYKTFLQSHLGKKELRTGGIYNTSGKYLGPHDGIEMYTVGQRKGLPGGSPQPLYVVDIDPAHSRVIVGFETELIREEFEVEGMNWLGVPLEGSIEVSVKIRSTHRGTLAVLHPMDGKRALVRLQEPQRAIAPGQAAVFYHHDQVRGGGWICRKKTSAG